MSGLLSDLDQSAAQLLGQRQWQEAQRGIELQNAALRMNGIDPNLTRAQYLEAVLRMLAESKDLTAEDMRRLAADALGVTSPSQT